MMSDPDSDRSVARKSRPNNSNVEVALRSIVKEYQRTGRSDELTVNNVRTAAISRLGVSSDFFQVGIWKGRSKEIIRDQADKDPDTQVDELPTNDKKRKATDSDRKKKQAQSKKRRTSNDSNYFSETSDIVESYHASKIARSKSQDSEKPGNDGESALSSIGDEDVERTVKKVAKEAKQDHSDSELSILIDDDPPPKKRGKRGAESQPIERAKAPKSKKEVDIPDPDKEEIKRLQGWLIKCGIRKLWGKELASHESSKAKIRHLKHMLADAGMTGRYSLDKARQIKEARELAADLEAVQEGNRVWGKDAGEDQEEEEQRPRRRLAKGLKELDFISDDDSE